jgi:hypothetical protein
MIRNVNEVLSSWLGMSTRNLQKMDRQKQEFRSSVSAKRSNASEAEVEKKKTKRVGVRVRRETLEGIKISER